MMTKRYKAIWVSNQSCVQKGKEIARCEADNSKDFANSLCTTYANELGDSFCFNKFKNENEIKDCFGNDLDDLPDWFNEVTAYPVLVFTSNAGTEILCNPTATAIIRQIASEHYGDSDLTIKGF